MKTIQKREFEPFIAHTFDYPPEQNGQNNQEDKQVPAPPLAQSSNNMMLYEACAATSAGCRWDDVPTLSNVTLS